MEWIVPGLIMMGMKEKSSFLMETGRAVEMRVTRRAESFDLSKYAKGMYTVRIQKQVCNGDFKISVK